MSTKRLDRAPIVLPYGWNPGQHMVVTGINGSGKSTLVERICDQRRFLMFFRTKPDDVRYRTDLVVKDGDAAIRAMRDPRINRIEVNPPRKAQAAPIGRCVEEALNVEDSRAAWGGWTLLGDEGYRIKLLGLMPLWEEGYTQGRSMKLSMVTAVQRPVFVSRFIFSESAHVISFGCEGRDLLALRDGVSRRHAEAVAALEEYQFAWTHRRGGRTWTTVARIQDLQGKAA